MARILVADDEPSLLKVLQVNLEMEGHETLLASDGETALRRIESDEPDVVLLDVMMPLMDGWEVLRRIPGLKLRKKPKVILMTAKAGEQDLLMGTELGADRYLTKPFDIDNLIRIIKQVIEE